MGIPIFFQDLFILVAGGKAEGEGRENLKQTPGGAAECRARCSLASLSSKRRFGWSLSH